MTRPFLIIAHSGRPASIDAAIVVGRELAAAGASAVCLDSQFQAIRAVSDVAFAQLDKDIERADVELVICLGGDGTILKAAEIMRGTKAPLLGVNMGHVGFLAELEVEDLESIVARVLAKDYAVDERLTLDVAVELEGKTVFETWALNEASIEKMSRERMIEVVIGVDDRPISTFGCDGVLMATPTGSTAYSFSAGGPVVWPTVEALIMVPLSAHALFARPLVTTPDSVLTVDLLDRTGASGVLWCDGRRTHALAPGSRIVARRSATPVRLAHTQSGPFSQRLVKKFSLPTEGWRGSSA
ncbi:MAG: kinase [Actinomycetota bacterium]|jgi:NAD+ kinase